MIGGVHLRHVCMWAQKVRAAFFAVLALIGAVGAASPAAAQCQLCPPEARSGETASASFRPLRITITANLDFSRVAAGDGGGAVSIDPVSGTRDLSGDIVDLGGMMLGGEVTVTGEPGQLVHVDIPRDIILESDDGRTARVTDLGTSLSPAPRLGPDGVLTFRFGGRLNVGRDDDGNYRGRIPINVEYEVR
ncbi:MAG: hypothetical protein RLZZ58_255 [Pseudomonadota bacterium]